MAKWRLAYGPKGDIETAIDKGTIPPGTLILTEDSNEMYFYNLDCTVCAYQEKYKFSSKQEAEEWVSKYNCRGEILSVHEDNECNIYVVNYDNTLRKFESSATPFVQVQADWNETDPESPAYIKNKPDVTSGNDRHYVHNQLSPSSIWDIHHNLNKFPAVTVVDSAGSLVVGDVVYKNNNNLILTFVGAFSGKCYCN